jgi:hypothetical protein
VKLLMSKINEISPLAGYQNVGSLP